MQRKSVMLSTCIHDAIDTCLLHVVALCPSTGHQWTHIFHMMCMYIHVRMYMYIHMYVHIMYVCTCRCICIVYVCACTYIHVCTCLYVHVCTHMYMYVRVCMYLYVCICMYVMYLYVHVLCMYVYGHSRSADNNIIRIAVQPAHNPGEIISDILKGWRSFIYQWSGIYLYW